MENLLLQHNDEQKQKTSKLVYDRYKLSKGYYSEKFNLIQKCYKLYGVVADDAGDTDEPDIKIAFIYGIVEKLVSKLAGLLSGKLPVKVGPKQVNHKKQAETFYEKCKNYFNSAFYRIEYTNSCRQRVIGGTSWEVDEWLNEWEEGWRWAINKVNQAIDVNLPTLGPVIKPIVSAVSKVVRNVPVSKYIRKPHRFPVNVGYGTRFPSVFRMFPQPGIIKVEDMKWIIEEVPFAALGDLEKAKYFDPESGELKPVYDLSTFLKEKEENPDRTIVPSLPDKDDLESFIQEYTGAGKDDKSTAKVDGLHLLIMRCPREIVVIANGKEVIQHIKDPFHKPGLRVRKRVYTPDAFSPYGKGAIEPVIPMLEELDDVHNLAMQNWVRIINRMIIYDETAIPYPDDFLPRAGGRIRAKDGADLPRAIMPIDHADVTGPMITTESNLRGLIETILAVTDFSPGVQGAKPYHDTYGGLIELQRTYAERFGSLFLLDQAEMMKQMDSMYWMYDQFMFEPVDIQTSFGAVQFNREDIDTDGMGFYYTVSDDPSYGDPIVQRNQNMVLLSTALNFETTRINLRKDKWKELQCDKLMEDVLFAFKHSDVSEYLKDAADAINPDDEFKFMLQGLQVQVNPKENLVDHYLKHLMQMRSIERGTQKYPPEVVAALSEHLAETQKTLQMVAVNPELFLDDAIKQQIIQEEAIESAKTMNVNLGQNLPANVGGRGGGGG